MKNQTMGEALLDRHEALQERFEAGGDEIFVSLIAACISAGTDRFTTIVARVSQIAGKDCSERVFLALNGTGSFAFRELPWFCDDYGRYGIVPPFRPEEMTFWQPAGDAR